MNKNPPYFTEIKLRPNTFDIPYRAKLCLKNMLEMTDKSFGCVPYIGASIGEDKPHFVHHRLDATEVLPYSIVGIAIARRLCGSDEGLWIQMEQKKTMLSLFSEKDGLVYTSPSPWYKSDYYNMSLWEQARIMYALLYWYMDEENEDLLVRMHKMTDALYLLSRQEGAMRVFSDHVIFESVMDRWAAGALIDPLMRLYSITCYPKALELARGIFYYYLNPQNVFFTVDGKANGYFRASMGTVNGISCYAAYSGDEELIKYAKKLHDYAISCCTAYGSTPCHEPACSGMELNMSALSLIRAGYDEYYDQIDRFVRNQIAEAQFLDTDEWVESKTHRGRIMEPKFVYEDYPEDLGILPSDDYDNIVERCVGGFMWCTADEHSFMPASVMLCCSAHAMRSFKIIWENALVLRLKTLYVNFFYNMENDLGEIISYEPVEGKATIIVKVDVDMLKIRIPEYAVNKPVSIICNQEKYEIRHEGRYAVAGPVKAGSVINFIYPLCERVTDEQQCIISDDSYTCKPEKRVKAMWRGNTVMGLSPEATAEKHLYKRQGDKEMHEVQYYIDNSRKTW